MKKKRKFQIVVIGLIVLLGLGIIIGLKNKKSARKSVEILKLERGSLESEISTMGKVSSMDKREITSDVEEKIKKLYVKKGDIVKTGQVLMELDRTNINHKIEEAETRLNIEIENLNNLKKKDNLALEVSLSNSKINYEDMKNEYERNKLLYEEGAIDKVSLDKSKDARDEAYNNLILSEDNLKKSDVFSDIRIQEERVKLSRMEVSKIRDELVNYTIKSPISGTIVELDVSEEGIVESHIKLMTIQDISNLELDLELSDYDASSIKEGTSVEISSDSIESKVYKGKIKNIDQIVKSNGENGMGSVEVKSSIENIDERLKSGLSMRAKILVERKDNIIKLPYEAIKQNDEGSIVYIVEDGRVKEMEVSLGLKGDFEVEAIGKLEEGMSVILNPDEDLVAGEEVEVL